MTFPCEGPFDSQLHAAHMLSLLSSAVDGSPPPQKCQVDATAAAICYEDHWYLLC